MKIEITDAVWLDERQQFSLAELVDLSGLPEPELKQLIDYETLLPTDPGAGEARFGAHCLVIARMACRLRNDFDLDSGGLALTLTLLERIRALEAQLRALRVLIPQQGKY
jgi:chaperone modulatory protein CbpM